jgi:hypothetical protein
MAKTASVAAGCKVVETKMVEQRGNEPLASALRTAKMAFSWTTLFPMKPRHFRPKT